MNKYNRQNPFMYLLEHTEDTTVHMIIDKNIKNMMRSGISGLIAILSILISWIFGKPNGLEMLMIIFVILTFAWNFLQIRYVVRSLNIGETNEMIFGDRYENIDLNNEKLLVRINKANNLLGKTEFINEYTTLLYGIYFMLIGFFWLRILGYIFH